MALLATTATLAPMRPAAAQRHDPVIRRHVYVISFPTGQYDPAHVLKKSRDLAEQLSEATAFHAYKDPAARPYAGFDIYQDQAVVEDPLPAKPNGVYDLGAVYRRHDICNLVRQGLVDEVWIWEGGFGGLPEWAVSGPDWTQDEGTGIPNCGRHVPLMALHNSLGVDFALHSFAHRMEGTMRRWHPCDFSTSTWPWPARPAGCYDGTTSDRTGFVARPFAGNDNVAACGDVHTPPNVPGDNGGYQYSNPDPARSICEDWRRDGQAKEQTITCENWGCTQLGFMRWWLQNIPGYDNTSADRLGRPMDNWWVYYFLGQPDASSQPTPLPTEPTRTPSPGPTARPSRTRPPTQPPSATPRPIYRANMPLVLANARRYDLPTPYYDSRPTATPLPTPSPTADPDLRVAYVVPLGTGGSQDHQGSLGLDFDVIQPIRVTHLGAFDSLANGLMRPINVFLVNRVTRLPVAEAHLTGEIQSLAGGSRLLRLAEPLDLPAGFRGSIVAEGYGPGEPNGNSNGDEPVWTTDDGDGALRFVGGGRYANEPTHGTLPALVDNGPANRYAAGTFGYVVVPDVP